MTLLVNNNAQTPAAAGLTLYLAPGTYSGLYFNNLNFANGITIASLDPLNPAIITVPSPGGVPDLTYGHGLYVSGSSNITFSNLKFQAPGGLAVGNVVQPFIVENGSSNITFDHDSFTGTSADPTTDVNYLLRVNGSSNVTITNSTFSQGQNGIALLAGDTHVTVSNNTFHDLESDGIDSGGTNNLIVANNTFTNFYPTSVDHPDAIQLWTTGTTSSTHDVTITGNTISEGTPTSIAVNGTGGLVLMQGIFVTDSLNLPYQNVNISNNTLIGTSYNGITVASGQNITISGNTLLQTAQDVPIGGTVIRLDTVSGLTLTNNVTSSTDFFVNMTPVTGTGNTINGTVQIPAQAPAATPGPSNTPSPGLIQTVSTIAQLQAVIAGSGFSINAMYSSDASQLLFSSNEALVAADTDNATDVYAENLSTKVLTQISTTYQGLQANGASEALGYSSDGASVLFLSKATNLTSGVDANGTTADIYKKNLSTGAVSLVLSGGPTANRFSNGATLSANGNSIVFSTLDFTFNSDSTVQVYIANASTGVVTPVSHAAAGGSNPTPVITLGVSTQPIISADGSKVAFLSTSKYDTGDTNGKADIFVYDVATHAITRVTNYQGTGNLTVNAFSPSLDKLYYTDTTTPGGGNPNDVLHVVALNGLADQVVGVGLSGAMVSADGQFIATSRDVQLGNGSWTHQAELLRIFDGAVQDLHAAGLQNTIGTSSVLAFAPTGNNFVFADGTPSELTLVSGVSTFLSDFAQSGQDALLFRNAASGDWGFMSANLGGGQTWHPIGGSSPDYAPIGRGDFNGDGVLETAYRQTSTGSWGFLTIGPRGGESWHQAGSASLAYDSVATGDILHSGSADIVFRNAASGDWGFMSTDGAGNQAWHPIGASSAAYSVVGSGDFNGDGIFDVAFRNGATGDWGFMSVLPTGGETWHPVGSASTAYNPVASADFLGNGQTEIVYRNPTTGDWGFMQANLSGGETWHPIGASGAGYAVIGNGDFNGDHVQDVAFRNTATGDWGYMTVLPTGGEVWHPVGNASLAYGTI